MFTACESFSKADDRKKGMGPGCSVLQRDAVSRSSIGGTGAEGDIELINKGEKSHPDHIEKCQRIRKEDPSCLASVPHAYQRGR